MRHPDHLPVAGQLRPQVRNPQGSAREEAGLEAGHVPGQLQRAAAGEVQLAPRRPAGLGLRRIDVAQPALGLPLADDDLAGGACTDVGPLGLDTGVFLALAELPAPADETRARQGDRSDGVAGGGLALAAPLDDELAAGRLGGGVERSGEAGQQVQIALGGLGAT